jgi:hypothetical protein
MTEADDLRKPIISIYNGFFLYIYPMINELTSKQIKDYQILLSWKDFYLECANEWESMKIDRKIARFEEKYFG